MFADMPLANSPPMSFFRKRIAPLTAVVLTFIAALALLRALYEGAFPRLAFLAVPLSNLLIAGGIAGGGGLFLWRWAARKSDSVWLPTAVFLPLLLNLLYLPQTAVNPPFGNFLLFTSIWLTALLTAHLVQPHAPRWRDALFLLIYTAPIYLLTMGRTVGKADSFEFQVVIPQLEIAHPTGYPLYILLTKLLTLFIPVGGMAWRVNVITAGYALLALYLLYELMRHLTKMPIIGVLTAALFALTPTFWSQAINAEVYSLNSLIVTAALLLMAKISREPSRRLPFALAAVLGLGLTNHLTTVILLLTAVLTLFSARKKINLRPVTLPALLIAFLLPLSLYAYLPIRWQALHDEPMGASRFIEWVIAGRFRGALQLWAWLHDPARYTVVARLFTAEWTLFYLLAAAIGLLILAKTEWRHAFALTLIFTGYSFYALNYYVPDLAVFLIPAHLIIAILIGTAAAKADRSAILFTLFALPLFARAGMETWAQLDQSTDDGLTRWGEAVLALPLAENGAILADSEKIAPLYYLQRAEGMRPDLDILVLPDEAAYRAEVDGRLAASQPVYLARYLPALHTIYHLRGMGPLTVVSTRPLTDLPDGINRVSEAVGELTLIGYTIEADAAIAEGETAVTLYWQADAPVSPPLHIYMRWQNGDPINRAGTHPVHNNYPTNAWRDNEIVPDFYTLPRPISPAAQEIALQTAVAPPFTPADALDWHTITTVTLPPTDYAAAAQEQRILLGDTALSGITHPARLRPDEPLHLLLRGYGDPALTVTFANQQSAGAQIEWQAGDPFVEVVDAATEGLENGRYPLTLSAPDISCGWMRTETECLIGTIEISGVRLPADAINYDDKIGLLDIDLPPAVPTTGGLPITLHWQALAKMEKDYTVFIQLLDENDQIAGQIDAWPLQGTYPTSQWQVGETIDDPYLLPFNEGGCDGQCRLLIGFYLLADLRRLPILNTDGTPIDDKWSVTLRERP